MNDLRVNTYFYPALVLFEKANCIDWINTVTNRNITFSGNSSTCLLPVEFWEPYWKSNSLPFDRKYQKGKSTDNYIILLFNSKYKQTLCVFGTNWGSAR